MRRRLAAGIAAVGLTAVAAVSGSGTAGGVEHRPSNIQPNILIVVTDDQPLGTMQVMPKTRRWLKAGGVRYRNAYVTTPQCCPSRSSIFTGRYAHNHRVKDNYSSSRLDHSTTLQAALTPTYQTALYGKFLNGWSLDDTPPYFDEYAVQGRSDSYYNVDFNINGQRQIVSDYNTSFIADQAVGFLDRAESTDDQPWFLVLAPTAPHLPYTVEEKYAGAPVPPWDGDPAVFEEDKSDKPGYVQSATLAFDTAQSNRAKQLRTLMSVDDMMGRLHDSLVQLAEDPDTLVVFISDNGYMWGQHGLNRKAVPYSESIRVPMYVRWPGQLPQGRTRGRPVTNIDIAPTALQAAGLSPVTPMDGRSLVGGERRDRVLTELFRARKAQQSPPWASLRTETAQYVEYYGADGEVTFREYYDLAADRYQLVNLLEDGDPFNDPTAEVAQLAEQLAADRACAGASCP
ncbi:MAG: sulfatase [Actinomycetota bacterium]|nr:sulfatase [Actinomycetota bacterium]